MSAYKNDPRVRWPGADWPPHIQAMIPDPDGDCTRLVQSDESGRFVVVGATLDDATLTDPGDRYNRRLQVFTSVDEAISAIIGEPQVAA